MQEAKGEWGQAGAHLALVDVDLAEVHLRPRNVPEVHPADLDDALGVVALTLSESGSSDPLLPFAVDSALLGGAKGDLWAVRRPRSASPNTHTLHP